MQVYCREGHISTLTSPICGNEIDFMGEVYVDNTDLLTIKDNKYGHIKVYKQAQVNHNKQAHLLNTTRGALNPAKCYWYIASYTYHDELWQYGVNNTRNLRLTIPLPNGTMEEIAQLPITEARNMLGIWSSPDGLNAMHLQEVVVSKVTKLADCLKNAQLPTHLAWEVYCHQLWPGVKYQLSTLANSTREIDGILHKLEFKILSFMEVNRHVKTEWRHIAQDFGRIGLFNWVIEQFIGWMETLLQHYGTGSTIAKKIWASIELMRLEIGCTGNPLNEDFDLQGILATLCWAKVIWERAFLYNFCLVLDYPVHPLPREGNIDLVNVFIDIGKHLRKLRV